MRAPPSVTTEAEPNEISAMKSASHGDIRENSARMAPAAGVVDCASPEALSAYTNTALAIR